MGLSLDYIFGQTPLDDDEKEGLLIPTITTKQELDEFEQNNIEEAVLWSLGPKNYKSMVLTEGFIKRVHFKMFGNIWDWAGNFRKTNKNIGVDKYLISSELKMLLDDIQFWVENKTFSPDEICIRFKHRLVVIHCFPNGNGRHSRLMGDILISKLFKVPVFTWGSLKYPIAESRKVYLNSLRKADQGNIKPLLEFARS